MNSPTEPIQFRKTFIVSICVLELVVLLVNGFSVVFYMNDSNHRKSSATDLALAYTLNVENMLYGVFLLLGNTLSSTKGLDSYLSTSRNAPGLD